MDAKKERDDERKKGAPPIGLPSPGASAPLPNISLAGGAASAGGAGSLLAGSTAKAVVIALVGSIGAFGLQRAFSPAEPAAPLTVFATKAPFALGTGAAAQVPAADSTQIAAPIAVPDAAGSPVGGAMPAQEPSAQAADRARAMDAAGGAAPDGSPPPPSGASASSPRAASGLLKPLDPARGAGGAGSAANSASAAAAAQVPGSGGAALPGARSGASKGNSMSASAAGSAHASIVGGRKSGALRQLQAAAASSKLGASRMGETSSGLAARAFDNNAGVGGGGAALGGAGQSADGKPAPKANDGGQPIDSKAVSAGALPAVSHADVTPWGALVTAATFLLLGAGLLLLTAGLLASRAKHFATLAAAEPEPLKKAALYATAAHFHTAAQVVAGTAGLMGLAAVGLGAKILSMGSKLQGIMMIAGGAIVTVLAVKTLIEEHDAQAEVTKAVDQNRPAAEQALADKQAAAEKQAMTEALHDDPVHHMSTEAQQPLSSKPSPLDQMIEQAKAPPEPRMSSMPPETADGGGEPLPYSHQTGGFADKPGMPSHGTQLYPDEPKTPL